MSRQYYQLSGVVYDQNPDCLKSLFERCRHWVYIIHDKDEKENGETRDVHIHFIATFVQRISFELARSLVHSEGNVFVQDVIDIKGMFSYLTHNTSDLIDDGKYRYSDDELKSDNIDYWVNRCTENEHKTNNESFYNDLMSSNFEIREMAIKYGRDFIKNYNRYIAFREAVLFMDKEKNDETNENNFKKGVDN